MEKHTECLTSPALSPTASFAAEARVLTSASLSFATSVFLVSGGTWMRLWKGRIKDVRLLPSLLAWSAVPLRDSDAEFAVFEMVSLAELA